MDSQKSLRELAQLALDGRYQSFDIAKSVHYDCPNLYHEGYFVNKQNFYMMTAEEQCLFLLFVEVSSEN